MKEQVKDMFTQVTMPPKTQRKVRQAVAEHKKVPQPLWKRAAMAATVMLLVVSLSPTVRAAVNNWVVKYFWADSDITIYEMTDENGEVVSIAGVDTGTPSFARMVNGRLYFLGNGEKIDITDQIGEMTPYLYTYVDEYDLKHFMFVGYEGSLDNFGIYEFIKEKGEGQSEWNKWVTGTGRNFLDPVTETRYPWVDIVWATIDVPWPMPE